MGNVSTGKRNGKNEKESLLFEMMLMYRKEWRGEIKASYAKIYICLL
jgi:hypothetical protein